jgi:hypothetical protein
VIDADLLSVQYALVSVWGVGTLVLALRVPDPGARAVQLLWGNAIIALALWRSIHPLPPFADAEAWSAAALGIERSMVINAMVMAVVAVIGAALLSWRRDIGRILLVQGMFLTGFDLTWAAVHHRVHLWEVPRVASSGS